MTIWGKNIKPYQTLKDVEAGINQKAQINEKVNLGLIMNQMKINESRIIILFRNKFS